VSGAPKRRNDFGRLGGDVAALLEPLNPQKGNIVSITRHEIREISDENRGQPIISQAVVHCNVAYFAGITPNPIVGDLKTQTAQVLRRVDELLDLAGTDKSHL
jgi:enamine deaminase RidA (YjgF/YER057c/UK114 family)